MCTWWFLPKCQLWTTASKHVSHETLGLVRMCWSLPLGALMCMCSNIVTKWTTPSRVRLRSQQIWNCMENQWSCAVIGQCCVGVRSVRNVIDSCSMIWTAVTKKLSQTEPHGGGDPVVKIILWIYVIILSDYINKNKFKMIIFFQIHTVNPWRKAWPHSVCYLCLYYTEV